MVWLTVSSCVGVDGQRYSVLHWRVTVNKCKIAIVNIARSILCIRAFDLIIEGDGGGWRGNRLGYYAINWRPVFLR